MRLDNSELWVHNLLLECSVNGQHSPDSRASAALVAGIVVDLAFRGGQFHGRRQMRMVSWLLGIALVLIAGGAVLEAGVLVLLPLVPAVVWAAREKARPLGLGGLIVGFGGGMAGLLALANARCAASNVSGPNYFSECVAPDLTPYLAVAAVLTVIGAALSLFVLARRPRPTA